MQFLKNKIYFLAGATGTEIQRRGFPTTLPLWSAQVLFEKPELLKQIYIDYIQAGADIITTNTFRTQRRTLAKVNKATETESINNLAVQIAVAAREESKARRPVYIAGCLTTLEDCYRPDLAPGAEALHAEHSEQVKILAATPIDFFLLETINSIREAVAMAKAVFATGRPFAVSFVANSQGDILNGDTFASAVEALKPYSPMAIMVNCVPPEVATLALQKIKFCTDLPFGAYANGDGNPADGQGWEFHNHDRVAEYTQYCRSWQNLGATIIGGCCGTNPDYTQSYCALK